MWFFMGTFQQEATVETSTPIEPTTPLTDGGNGMSQAGAHAREMGRRAARTLAEVAETAMRRVRDRDLSGALSDIRRLIDERPGAALLAAAAVGFLLARSLTRR
jgi:hypothetical protein